MKKIVCVVLSVLFLLQMSFVVSAKSDTELISANARNGIVSALNDIEYIKDKMGWSSINFTNLYVSGAIGCYIFTENGLQEAYEHIPLFNQDELIAFAVKVDDRYHISTYLAEQIRKLPYTITKFAIIYDKSNIYLYDNTNLILVANSNKEIQGRSILSSKMDFNGIELNIGDVLRKELLGYTKAVQTRVPVYYGCNVSYVPQNNYPICWAAAAACVINYKQNRNLTAREVAERYYGSDWNQSLPVELQSNVLALYGLRYETRGSFATDGEILSNIMNGYPICATAHLRGDGESHEVVVYGINISTPLLYVMDSNRGSTTAYYDSGERKYYFYDGGGLLRYYFYAATCKYWD